MTLLLRFLRPYKLICFGIIVTLAINLGTVLLVPTILANMINIGISTRNLDFIITQAGWMLIVSLFTITSSFSCNLLSAHLATRVGRDIRNAVYDSSLRFSSSDFDHFGAGSMITRSLGDITIIQQGISNSLQLILPAPVGAIVGIVLAYLIDPFMGGLITGCVVIVSILAVISVKRASAIFERLQSFIDRINVRLRECITGVRVIRAFGKEKSEQKSLNAAFDTYATNAIKVNWIFATLDTSAFFIMNMAEIAIIWLGGDRVGVHAMQIASISACVEYAMLILFFIMTAQICALSLPRAFVCLERCREVIDYEPSIIDAPDARVSIDSLDTLDSAHAVGELGVANTTARISHDNQPILSFNDVTFQFSDASEPTLSHISFDCCRGTTTAIIGQTGSGKSTIAKLALRMHDASAGHITLGGVDVRVVSQQALRDHISYVPQKAWLFSGNIADNLRDGKPDATDGEMWHALAIAQGDFVHELPMRLQTHVSQGGSNFSGGQRQRLAIARALIKPADVYIFDDSFSALDYTTDRALRKALASEIHDAAVLIIAQRINTILQADQIVVLHDGVISGIGTHRELLHSCEAYRNIASSQLSAEEIAQTLEQSSNSKVNTANDTADVENAPVDHAYINTTDIDNPYRDNADQSATTNAQRR